MYYYYNYILYQKRTNFSTKMEHQVRYYQIEDFNLYS